MRKYKSKKNVKHIKKSRRRNRSRSRSINRSRILIKGG